MAREIHRFKLIDDRMTETDERQTAPRERKPVLYKQFSSFLFKSSVLCLTLIHVLHFVRDVFFLYGWEMGISALVLCGV